jgi:hypothetical protein
MESVEIRDYEARNAENEHFASYLLPQDSFQHSQETRKPNSLRKKVLVLAA